MQALCGLQGIFDLFNCKTPEQILNMFSRTRTNAEFVQMAKKQKFL